MAPLAELILLKSLYVRLNFEDVVCILFNIHIVHYWLRRVINLRLPCCRLLLRIFSEIFFIDLIDSRYTVLLQLPIICFWGFVLDAFRVILYFFFVSSFLVKKRVFICFHPIIINLDFIKQSNPNKRHKIFPKLIPNPLKFKFKKVYWKIYWITYQRPLSLREWWID